MEMGLISILMTAYNREMFIEEAIQSVLASSYKNLELIIVDDGSKDGTVAIAKKYEELDTRVKVYLNHTNLGDYPNRNKAVSYAKGEYIMFVDSDDTIFEHGIENCIRLMKSFPSSSFGIRLFNKDCDPFELQSKEAISRHFFHEPILGIGPGGTVIKRSLFEQIKGYPEIYGPANDMYFNLKASANSNVVMIPFEFLYYRRHDGQEINNKQSYLYNTYLFLRDALNELPLGLTREEIQWLQSKNKRRFLVNILKYFTKTFNLPNTAIILKRTKFGMKDVLQAIFH
jgi:glycosyltransferase involved in cell wall biosynthesis